MQTYVQHHCVVDAKRLDEYGLSTRNLPAGCEIQNPIRNIWTDYKGVLLAGMGIILVQGATIGSLFWQRRRRRAAELKSRNTQSELQRAMRFATMGELTASIAHEINQPLGAILSNAEAAEMLLQRGTATQEDMKAILADIRRDDQRSHLVVSRLRTLLKKSEVQHEPVHWHDSIRDTLTLFMPGAKRRGVAVALSLDTGRDVVSGDPVQLQQVLLNLVINAMDALDGTERHLRRVQIQTKANAEHIILTVQDNGHGMTDEAHTRIFDSFYTTKQEGLGMGLTIVRTIVESLGGKISVQSEPGKGAAFNVQLPLLKEQS
jgi:C4-dicarboxylate-specific signal transduction histidine kinase